MTTNIRWPAIAAALAVVSTLTIDRAAAQPKFLPDDPAWVEPDTEDASAMAPLEMSLFVDLAYSIVAGRRMPDRARALNVNTIDEVPDSSWFTNRAGRMPLTAVDIARGPDTTSGPARGPWTVTSSKSDGVTPGFTIRDGAGLRWFLKFDPPGHRGMTTGTEVVVTKLMWALGYNVPENHIAYLRREQLVVGDGATFTPPGGRRRALRIGDVDRLLERTDREVDGSYRVVASRALDGRPIGRIRFHGTRPDDPNDVVPHEDRRELRAYGVFAAWLNHVDAKAINSLDTLVTENGRSVVRHNLLDFGSTLGSGGVAPADYWAGTQYLVEPSEILRRIAGFGLSIPAWRTAAFYESPSIGRLPLDNTTFDPERWRPRVPNLAFLRARADDKFWAARRLALLTTDLLRAAVGSGDFRDPGAEEFLVRALAERRDAIVRRYLTALNPIVDPVLDEDGLSFRNAAVDADVARAPEAYHIVWSAFDNATGASAVLGETVARSARVKAPADLPHAPGTFIKIELSAIGGTHASWASPVHTYFRRGPAGWALVGFERMPGQP
ncbi:MAG: hypothetical protein IT176_00585 [Acidobacteria bacterium]|nr:hypothetical protein [Acidobacteriota bacterium]